MVDIFDRAAARAEITPLAAKVWRHCEAKGLHGRTAMLTVKYADFQIITRSKTAAVPIATIDDPAVVTQSLLDSLFPAAKGIRLLGVMPSSFTNDESKYGGPDRVANLGTVSVARNPSRSPYIAIASRDDPRHNPPLEEQCVTITA